ncbi:hypothetical protein J4573_35350 [Actinomadura barringtoniae]|uniref:Uncharacterized protein n=1 Tax=Actinomadura barringtoniae TaxID=1427535 RepID=A0A939PGG1_9ACTN|nr:hypothetical protein [Actinomadura barringtoniae]MBO2452412.1 hypothetical protein [Actinomadura barringtoniae]
MTWPYVLVAVLALAGVLLTVRARRARSRARAARASAPPKPIDLDLVTTSYTCRRCRHNWTAHQRGMGTCTVEGPPYTTETTVGWEADITQTTSGTACGCPRYDGIEPS